MGMVCWVPRGDGVGGRRWGVGESHRRAHTLYIYHVYK